MRRTTNKPKAQVFPPLETVTQPGVGTAAAAFYLDREQQTLRIWHCTGKGPIQPTVVNGRLNWSTAKIRCLVGVEQVAA